MQWAQNKAYVTVDLQKSDPPPRMFVHDTGYDPISSGFGNVFTGLVRTEWYNFSCLQCYV